ncbi:MAG TPA: hypothetical protein VGB53_05670 [Rubricoccaceae bacterium]
MSKVAAQVLQSWITNRVFTPEQIAEWADVSDGVLYKYRTGDRQMPVDVAARISRAAQRSKGRTELADCLNTDGFVSTRVAATATDGSISDEACGSLVHWGRVVDHFEGDDLDAADRAADEVIRLAHNAKAEIAQRRGRLLSSPDTGTSGASR